MSGAPKLRTSVTEAAAVAGSKRRLGSPGLSLPCDKPSTGLPQLGVPGPPGHGEVLWEMLLSVLCSIPWGIWLEGTWSQFFLGRLQYSCYPPEGSGQRLHSTSCIFVPCLLAELRECKRNPQLLVATPDNSWVFPLSCNYSTSEVDGS